MEGGPRWRVVDPELCQERREDAALVEEPVGSLHPEETQHLVHGPGAREQEHEDGRDGDRTRHGGEVEGGTEESLALEERRARATAPSAGGRRR